MAVDYGIEYCEEVLKKLADIEDKMFDEKGHGFDKFGKEFTKELKYRRLLKVFKEEESKGAEPSFNLDTHNEDVY